MIRSGEGSATSIRGTSFPALEGKGKTKSTITIKMTSRQRSHVEGQESHMSNLGLFAQLACIWEATACKPGNVHRLRDFPDLHFTDFLTSAAAIGPVMERAAVQGVGMTVLEAIRTTRRVARTNTNLGVVLLLAPLAAVPDGAELRMGVANVLDRLEPDDAKNVFAAIRLAHAGGLARVPEQDVHGE